MSSQRILASSLTGKSALAGNFIGGFGGVFGRHGAVFALSDINSQ